MSVVGFDFGTQNSRVAVVRGGGVDVVCNEVSDRVTPYAGDAARTLQVGNFRNTVINLPRLIGRLSDEPAVAVEQGFETCQLAEKEGVVGAAVSYREEDAVFSNTELVGMFLSKLKAITYAETKLPVSDVVISVPSYFTEKERRSLIDAAEVAGLNCLRTVNDTTAAAVCYGMMKTDIPADKPKNVIILDIGFSSLKMCVASFLKGSAEIKGHAFDMSLGGRDFDEVLANHFAEHFLETKKVDIRNNKKALLRLRVACEKIKKILSGIQKTKLDLEALIDGEDFTLVAERAQFEELSMSLVDRVEKTILELLQKANISVEDIDSVEIIGGCTRIPSIKARIAQIFGKEASTTLNADEAVSRGCALLCAIDSPLVRVREYKIADTVYFPIKLVGDQNLGEVEIFPAGSNTCETHTFTLTLDHSISFPLNFEAHYSDLTSLPAGTPSQIAKFTVTAPKDLEINESSTMVFDAHVNSSGLVDITKPRVEVTTAVPTDEEGKEEAKTHVTSLSIKVETFRLPRATVQKMKDAEIAMSLHDRLIAEIDDRRNAVEEFIYEARNKLEECYSEVSSEQERESAGSALMTAEDWLYGEGAEVGKEEYVKKLDELKSIFKPFISRIVERAKAASVDSEASTPYSVEAPQMDMD
ncbi:putative heat shock protein hsp88 [Paramicrosporidium saccamoebae]|uniref:Putative heat shock protein hsp88 n=1 Tax=Paramicrosporidium saccamoebae TaxID=1246581 RepID=A0A2H9TGA8_9FUNG|nr:putative heat shock protein hsp88 [Paramicrosporidium saccamoebae]